MISLALLAQLLAVEYGRLHMRATRAREFVADAISRGADPTWMSYWPVDDIARRAYYGPADVVRIAFALECERLFGLAFGEGAAFATRAEVDQVLTHVGTQDLYAVSFVHDDGGRTFRCGLLDFANAAPTGAIIVNLSAVLRKLQADAARLALDAALGWHKEAA
jgi:hypothetical protein